MTLVGEPKADRNLDELLSLREQRFCLGHALVHNVFVRRSPKGIRKRSEKLPRTELDQVRKIGKTHIAMEICMDVINDPLGLLLGEPS
jgi:hypothetical protein